MHDSLGSSAIKVAYVLLQFAVSVVLARELNPDGYGVYTFALAVVSLLVIPAQMGFSGLLLRQIPLYAVRDNVSLLKGVIIRSGHVVLAASAAIMGISILVLALLKPTTPLQMPFAIATFLLPFLALLAVSTSALRGLGFVTTGQLPDQLLRPGILLALSILASFFFTLTPPIAMMANLCATVAAMMVAIWLLVIRLPTNVRKTKSEFQTFGWSRAALPFLLLAGTQVINRHIDILMLGVMATQDDVGLYRVAFQVADGVGLFLFAIATAITPHLARLHEIQDWARIQRILVGAHRSGFAVVLSVSLLLMVMAEPLVALVFGDQYVSSVGALSYLLLGKVGYSTVAFCGLALSMFGMAGMATSITAVTAMANILLNSILIPRMGIEGAAIATAASSLTVAICAAVWMRRRFHIRASAFGY